MVDADEFSGRSALITGGTRGIGKGIADRLRAGGATVLVAARSVPDGESHDVIAADVSTADGVAGQTFDVTFFSGIASIGDSLIFADVSAFTSFLLTGPVLISPLPQTGTPGHLIDTAAIATGSFILGDNDIISPKDPIGFALTITPQAAATPEPSTLLLLATGLATGMIGLASANPRPKPTLPAKN